MRIDRDALEKLQKLRDLWGQPMTVNSAARCAQHNKDVGGAPRSRHLSTETIASTAFDIKMLDRRKRHEFMELARSVGFNGIGLYKSFIHIDVRRHDAYWNFS